MTDDYEPFDSAYANQTAQGRAEVTAERDELKKQLAAKDAELERLREENARLTKRLEECYQHDESACKSNTELLRWIGELKSQFAEANRRLEAGTEFWFGEVCIWANKTQLALEPIEGNPQQWHVRKEKRGVGKPKHWLNTKFFSFDEAYQAAIAAGWLKPPTQDAAAPQEE